MVGEIMFFVIIFPKTYFQSTCTEKIMSNIKGRDVCLSNSLKEQNIKFKISEYDGIGNNSKEVEMVEISIEFVGKFIKDLCCLETLSNELVLFLIEEKEAYNLSSLQFKEKIEKESKNSHLNTFIEKKY